MAGAWLREQKFRWRLASALREPADADTATPAELDRLVEAQLAPWRTRTPLPAAAARDVLAQLNAQRLAVWVLSIRGRQVRVWDKPQPTAAQLAQPGVQADWDAFRWRLMYYRNFLSAVAARAESPLNLDLALDVADDPVEHPGLPVLGFQKPASASTLLVPDVDFFHLRWYRQAGDPWTYDQKSPTACFVGASTGCNLDVDAVREDRAPRLRAARFFQGSEQVRFSIARAVQCTSDEARRLLEAKPYFGATVDWQQQLKHRFLISIDGNGAACSRLVQSLMSHSAVIQYESPHQLFYFSALVPGRHLLRVSQDAEVEAIVRTEQAQPGHYRGVAEAGQRFARKYLRAPSVADYTARLLAAGAPWLPVVSPAG